MHVKCSSSLGRNGRRSKTRHRSFLAQRAQGAHFAFVVSAGSSGAARSRLGVQRFTGMPWAVRGRDIAHPCTFVAVGGSLRAGAVGLRYPAKL